MVVPHFDAYFGFRLVDLFVLGRFKGYHFTSLTDHHVLGCQYHHLQSHFFRFNKKQFLLVLTHL